MYHLRRGRPPAVVDKKIIKQKKLIMGFSEMLLCVYLSFLSHQALALPAFGANVALVNELRMTRGFWVLEFTFESMFGHEKRVFGFP